MRRSTKWLLAGASAGTAAALTAAYGLVLRPWHLRWGATREELASPMPFDDLIREANYFATRAVTIDATPDQVWPFVIDTSVLPPGTVIRKIEEKRCVVFAPPEVEAEATWVVLLQPQGNTTRLISRNRARFGRRLSAVLRYLLVDPGQFVLERRWMLDVKKHAEELAREMQVTAEDSPRLPVKEPARASKDVAVPPPVAEPERELVTHDA